MNKIFVKKNSEGFSLAELLVVVAILTILAAIAIPLFLNQKKKAADGVVRSDLHNVGIDLASLYTGTVTTITGSDGTLSPNLTVDGMTVDKKGARVYANNTGQWCVSKVSTSGNIFAITSTNRSVYEATTNCIAPSTQPTGGSSGGGTIVSEEGNLLTTNQATLEDGTTAGLGVDNASATLTAVSPGYSSTYAARATTVAGSATYTGITTSNTPAATGVAGETYTLQAKFKTSAPARSVHIIIQFLNSGVVTGAPTVYGTMSGGTWTTIQSVQTAPAGTNQIRVYFRSSATASAGLGETIEWDNIGLWEGSGGQWAAPGQPIYQ